MTGSDRTWLVRGWHVYRKGLWDVSPSCQRMSGGSSVTKVEPWGVCCVVPTVDPLKDGNYTRHGCGSDETGRNCSTALLSCDPFFHQSDVPFLLFSSTTLRAEGGFEDVV